MQRLSVRGVVVWPWGPGAVGGVMGWWCVLAKVVGVVIPYDVGMEMLLVEIDTPDAARLILRLADEATEDPRCEVVLPGADEEGVVLATVWHASVAAEVADGLRAEGFTVRRMALVEA